MARGAPSDARPSPISGDYSASLEDFRDLAEVRKLIETTALRQAIEVGGEAWESEIVSAYYRLSKTLDRLREDPVGASAEYEDRGPSRSSL